MIPTGELGWTIRSHPTGVGLSARSPAAGRRRTGRWGEEAHSPAVRTPRWTTCSPLRTLGSASLSAGGRKDHESYGRLGLAVIRPLQAVERWLRQAG